MENSNGSVSINTENIFPIIKKWLYSEKDIFIREVISNAGDAISKLRKLANIGEAEIEENPDWKIQVIVDPENGTLTISDNGIGRTSCSAPSARWRFPARSISFRNTRARKTTRARGSSVTSVSASIQRLWFQRRLKSTRSPLQAVLLQHVPSPVIDL